MNDELRGELAKHRLMTPVQCACGWREADPESRTWARHVHDALLPLIDEHTAAAVAAERERIAAAIRAARVPEDHFAFSADAFNDGLLRAAIIAREEPADG